MYREINSDKEPSRSELLGTWRVTAASARRAALAGLPLADVEAGRLTLRGDGTCSADLYSSVCGHFPTTRYKPSDSCIWEPQGPGGAAVRLAMGEDPNRLVMGIHHYDAEPPLLWQYICDPDMAEYLEFEREDPEGDPEQEDAAANPQDS